MRSSDPRTVWGLLDHAASKHPNRVLVRDERGRSLTAAELHEVAEQAAAGLAVTATDIVSWQLPTVIESVVLMLAVARVGAVQNPIIPLLREPEVRHITGRVGTTVLVVAQRWRDFDHGAMAHALARDIGFNVVALDLEGNADSDVRLPLGDPAALPPPSSAAQGCRWIYFTSGTTAAPKGARHTDASVIASSAGIIDGLGMREGDVYPIAWPISHIGGTSLLTTVLQAGGTLALFDTFDPSTIGDRMAAVSPTILGTSVPFFRAYLDAQRRHGAERLYPDLRAFTAGGAALPAEIVRQLGEVFGPIPVVNSYGLTECPIATAPSPADPADALAATVGPPSSGIECRTVDGELRLKGPQVFLGYVDPEMDADAFDDRGWFRTGDLCAIDDDGRISVTGRLKDIIIRNAENISATEVEEVLLRHPDIVDVAVLGLPDPVSGERVCALVVPAPGRSIDLEMIDAHFRAQGIARQKTPEQVESVASIPRNPMGKILKTDLRAKLLADL